MVNVLTGLSKNRKLRIINSQEFKNIKNFENVLIIFQKTENIRKCADEYPEKFQYLINVLTILSKHVKYALSNISKIIFL